MYRKEIYNNRIKKIAEKERIKFTELSMGYVMCLEKDGVKRYILDNVWDLNSQASGKTMSDKYATEQILKENNIPTLDYEIIFHPEKRKDFSSQKQLKEKIENFIKENGKSVIKPNTGSNGYMVEMCETPEQAIEYANQIFEEDSAACLSPFYEIEGEYRCIYLDGEILLIFQKIPKEGEWRHNLNFGATPKWVEDKEKEEEIKRLAIQAAKIVNARFASVDIVRASCGKRPEKTDYVLEINSAVCMSKFAERMENGEQIVEEIYTKAMRKLWD